MSAKLGDIAADAGLHRIHVVAWRDLDDAEAGGSELHAHEVARLWAEAGIEVTMRTSVVVGQPKKIERDGYRVVRKTGRYLVFPRSALSGMLLRDGHRDGLVEIWNGMPFFSPLWARVPRVTWLHHVHAEMWKMMIAPPLDSVGRFIEYRVAPPLYRRSRIVTLSESSKREIVELLGLPTENISVVPPGIDARFSPAGEKSPHPLVAAVGRLVPVKRFHLLLDAVLPLKADHPGLEVVIVGEGMLRPELEARIAAAGASDWIRLPGRVSDDDLIDLYRRAWAVASTSLREGWGMTITEAAACGTPAVATRIGGHEDAVVDGHTGLLAGPDDVTGMSQLLGRVLADPVLRDRLSRNAAERAARFTWEATARGTLEQLAAEAHRRHRGRPDRA